MVLYVVPASAKVNITISFRSAPTIFTVTEGPQMSERIFFCSKRSPTNIINNVSSSAADIVVSLESVTTLNTKEKAEKKEEDHFQYKNKNNQNIRWPILQQKLCPNGIPNVTLGPTLFQLARKEFGLIEQKKKETKTKKKKETKKETKTTDITNNNNNNNDDDQNDENNNNEHDNQKQNQHKFVNYFYKGGFGFTIYINENDPTNTILYVPIWKCANDQIHSYLHKLYNRQSNGHIRQHNNITSNSNATAMMALYDNDTYLENLKINDMKFLFHKQVQQKMNSNNNNNNNSTTLINDDNDNDDDENNNIFTFNNTNRSKPCLFTVLRDPISHFLSGYNEVEFRLIEQTNDSPSKKNSNLAPYTNLPPWARANDKSNNNNGNVTITTTTINDNTTIPMMQQQLETRFIQFVQDVLEEHFSFYKNKFYKHFASMSRILPFLNDLNLLHHHTSTSTSKNNNNWYLSNLNNLTETFPTFLLNTCPNIGGRTTSTSIMNDDNSSSNNNSTSKGTLMTTTTTRNSNGDDNDNEDVVVDPTTATAAMDSISTSSTTIMPNMEIKGLHKSSKDIYGTYQAAKNVWNSNSRVAKSLCILHSFDYACYDFSSGSDSSDSNSGIPNICREVYESDLFYNGIILH
ncbi:hypothetical protein FRACYDRAFT_233558 [Fragilariopsis cylindrus CCMP1102]|uniref:Uncharacterized protein n=1 Tax=Fragilariopsis cylindrus CCMP1102 TaxID=635003 RepID=A0A1E7FZ19_9STRA|nr:hypothetical protein FRACYDRAFT_233558 [Fragilariopsis cylindrus CCMP1102]|eukprot:OEU23385.1 hypothetical protein FRACYDRAFT_233558 [Fragilariopsis cylindrus CCMP1102]